MDFDDLLNDFDEEPNEKPEKPSKSKKDLPPSQSSKPGPKKPGTSNHQDSYFDIDDEVEARPYTTKPKTKKKQETIPSDDEFFNILKSHRDHASDSDRSKQSESSLGIIEDEFQPIEKKIKQTRERAQKELEKIKSELSTRNHHESQKIKSIKAETLEIQRKEYDDQLKELQNVQESYEKIQNLSDNLGFSTTLLDAISQQLVKNKEDIEVSKNFKYEKKEKELEDRERNLMDQENKLERESLDCQESLESFRKQENELREYYDVEKKRVLTEIEKVHSVYLMINAEINEKKQEMAKESHKIKVMRDALEKRKEQVSKGVGNRLKELEDIEVLIVAKHEETLKMINLERRQISEKREKLEEKKRENLIFEEKLRQNSAIVERKESDINLAIEELLKNKNTLELQRSSLESEMQNMHKLSLKLHGQSEHISKSKEQLEAEFNILVKQDEDVENMRNYSRHEMLNAKETWKSLEQQLRTFERMSVSLIQELNPSSNWIIN